MDRFSYTIFLENIHNDHTPIPLDVFEEAVITLSIEDLDEIYATLTAREEQSVEDGKHTVVMLQVLGHYR